MAHSHREKSDAAIQAATPQNPLSDWTKRARLVSTPRERARKTANVVRATSIECSLAKE